MTTNQMIGRVRGFIDETSEKNFSNDFILGSLNARQWEIQSLINEIDPDYFVKPAEINPSPVTGVPGTTPRVARYLLPTDFIEMRRVEHKYTGEEISFIDINDKTTYSRDLSNALVGAMGPVSYWLSGQDIVFDPIPNRSMEVVVHYNYLIKELTLGPDVCELPRMLHEMVVAGAAMDCKIKDEATVRDLRDKWQSGARYIQTLGGRQSQTARMMG